VSQQATDAGLPPLTFRILGPIQVLRGDRELSLGPRKQRTLLALLLLDSGRRVSADRLSEELWHGRPPPSAGATLRSYISRLRSILGPEVRIAARGGGYALEGTALALDAAAFEEFLREGDSALTSGFANRAAERYRRGLELFRGRPLADVADDGVLALEGERLEELRVAAIEGRIEAELELGLHAGLIAELEHLVNEFPYREPFWRQLVLALYRSGRQADALAAYRRVRRILRDELGLDPSEELERLQQAVLRHDVAQVEPRPRQQSLPQPVSGLIGRDDDLRELRLLLRESRLVTVTGVGGVGKTRLAVAAAMSEASDYDRICFVDLSEIRDPGLVDRAVADALGIHESPHRPVLEGLLRQLRGTEALIVLDNCEHVRDRCAELIVSLIEGMPALRVLATSRDRLSVSGEVDYALSPLALPAEGASTEAARDSASVRLFVERAAASRASLEPTDDLIATVARICRDLDGIPLAIELAAVRAKALSADEIAAHLDRRFDFLKYWRRVAVPRHQTLRGTMDWSYDLLTKREQRTLRLLSVFAGGFTIGTAAQLTSLGDEAEAVDVLSRLVDRSLVVAEPSQSVTRYRLLETVRQYATERLVAAGEADGVAREHAEVFLRLATHAFSPGTDGVSVLAREQANLRVALEWAFDAGDEIGARLAQALGRFWRARWQLAEGRDWLERALSLHRANDVLRAELLGQLGAILLDIGDLAAAADAYAEALSIAGTASETSLDARLRVGLADVRVMLGETNEADALIDCVAAAARLEAVNDISGLSDALVVIGKLGFWQRDPSHRETLERAAALAHASGNRPAELLAAEWLATSLHDLNVPTDVAIARQEKLLTAVSGEARAEAGVLAPLAWSYGFAGRFEDARAALARSEAIYRADFGWTLDWAGCAMNAGAIELMAGDPPAAERLLRPAYEALRAMGEANYLIDTAYYLTVSLCEQGRVDDARQVVEATRSVASPGGFTEAAWMLAAARVEARCGSDADAERLASEGCRRLRASSRWLGQGLLTLGEVRRVGGRFEDAASAFQEALHLYEERRVVALADRARLELQALARS
jgi:predicted ATPase/DNA-binding SARP family transcriptional activator